MILGAMQPYFFPYIGYFQLIHAVDRFLLYDATQYTKHSWMNRNRTVGLDGGIRYISVPVKAAPLDTPLAEIAIDTEQSWQRYFCATVRHQYRRARYFDTIYPVLEAVMTPAYIRLSSCNAQGINAICALLGITTEIVAGGMPDISPEDADQLIAAGEASDRKHARVLLLCRREQAERYYNAIGGKRLYHAEEFARHGVTTRFIHSQVEPYRQFSAEFIPNLSIIDMLMHCGVAGTQARLMQYTLV